MNEKKRIILAILISALGIAMLSLTLGRDIFEGRGTGLLSFAAIHFSGYLFFLLMPVEIGFVYYLVPHNPVMLVLIAVATAMLAQIIDYGIGRLSSRRFINNIIGKKHYQQTKRYIDSYGTITIFIFNLFPLSSPIVALVAGMTRHSFRDVLLYSSIGLLLKYIVLALLF